MSNTKIEQRLRQKTDAELVNTIIKLKKINTELAKLLAMPKKKWSQKNLSEIDSETKNGETVFVPGKILSSGDLTKKIKIISWNISEKALEKIKNSGSSYSRVSEELKNDKELKSIKVLK